MSLLSLPLATTSVAIPLDEVKQQYGLPSITKKSKTAIVLGGSNGNTDGASSEAAIRFDLHDLIHAETAAVDGKDNRPFFQLDRETATDYGVRKINSNASSWAECMIPAKSLSSSTTYFEACQSVKCYRLPCPVAQNVSLSGGTGQTVTIDFVSSSSVLLHHLYGDKGQGLTIDVPWEALRRQFKGASKDGKVCVRHLTDAVLVGYDATNLPEDFRLTLHNGEREMSSALLGRADGYLHAWEATAEKPRGLLICAHADTFRPDRKGADRSAGQSLLTSNKEHFAWHHRLIGMDYKSVYEQIKLLPAADNYPVEIGLVTVNIGTLKVNPHHNRDFLVWMTAHYWTALFHLTVLHIKEINKGRSDKLPVSIPDADSGAVVVSREALLMLLDVLYSMSGQRSVVNLCDGLQVRLNVCGGKAKAEELFKWCVSTSEEDTPEALYARCLEGKMNLRFRIQFTFHEIMQLNPYASSYNLLLANDGYKQYQGRRQVTKDTLKANKVSLHSSKNGYLMAGSFMA
jgi:hypothetical protein